MSLRWGLEFDTVEDRTKFIDTLPDEQKQGHTVEDSVVECGNN